MRIALRVNDAAHRAQIATLVGGAGHTLVEGERADVVIVDDIVALEKIRARDPIVPILVVTAGDDVLARVAALRAGADDAVAAPFHGSQMMARVDALGRRGALVPKAHDVVEVDGCTIDLEALTATREDVVELTPREVAIVRFLALHRDRAVTRAELLTQVWGASAAMETRTVDMTIARLRKKIERDPAEPRIVVSAKGTGYRLG